MSKLPQSSSEVVSKFERSCVEVRVKLCRSLREAVSKFEQSFFFAKFASK